MPTIQQPSAEDLAIIDYVYRAAIQLVTIPVRQEIYTLYHDIKDLKGQNSEPSRGKLNLEQAMHLIQDAKSLTPTEFHVIAKEHLRTKVTPDGRDKLLREFARQNVSPAFGLFSFALHSTAHNTAELEKALRALVAELVMHERTTLSHQKTSIAALTHAGHCMERCFSAHTRQAQESVGAFLKACALQLNEIEQTAGMRKEILDFADTASPETTVSAGEGITRSEPSAAKPSREL